MILDDLSDSSKLSQAQIDKLKAWYTTTLQKPLNVYQGPYHKGSLLDLINYPT